MLAIIKELKNGKRKLIKMWDDRVTSHKLGKLFTNIENGIYIVEDFGDNEIEFGGIYHIDNGSIYDIIWKDNLNYK